MTPASTPTRHAGSLTAHALNPVSARINAPF